MYMIWALAVGVSVKPSLTFVNPMVISNYFIFDIFMCINLHEVVVVRCRYQALPGVAVRLASLSVC